MRIWKNDCKTSQGEMRTNSLMSGREGGGKKSKEGKEVQQNTGAKQEGKKKTWQRFGTEGPPERQERIRETVQGGEEKKYGRGRMIPSNGGK